MTDYLSHSNDWNNPDNCSVYDELSLWSSHFAALLLKHIELRAGITALDLACGTGVPLFELAHAHGRSGQFFGVDLLPGMLARADFKRRVYQWLDNAWLTQADGVRLPFGDATFDLITSALGVNNMDDPPAALAECARVAKPDARMVITSNTRDHMAEFYDVFRDVLNMNGKPRDLERLDAHVNHRASRESLSAMLEESGFQVTRVYEEAFEWRYLDGTALLGHSLTRFGFLDGWRAVVDPDDEAAIFATLESRLNVIAQERGELRVTIPMLYMEGMRV